MVYCKILNYFSLWLNSESVFQDKSIQDFFNCTFILVTKLIDFFEISQQKSTIYLGISCLSPLLTPLTINLAIKLSY